MKNLYLKNLFLLFIISMLASCNMEDDVNVDVAPSYEIPTFYNFDNVSYTGQTSRLNMMTEWKAYMGTSKTMGVALDADRMKAMFANAEGAGFSQEYPKQIKSKTFEAVQADFEALIDELAAASASTVAGSEGVSGVIESNDGAKSYLVGEDGLDHAQVIEKGLMGACFYYQGTSVYMGDDRMNVDNEIVEPGEGTAMEHHWDEAFGYLGVPKEFPVNTSGLVFWGTYTNRRNDLLNSNQTLMDAMLKGRAAISNDDLTARDEAITEARAAWEEVSVGTALHYLNGGIADFDDMALRSHDLSEAIGFVYSLQFNEGRKIDLAQINEILTLIAGSSDFENMNLYNTAVADLQTAKDKLAEYYGFEAIKDQF